MRKPLSAFRTNKRNMRSIVCKASSSEAHKVAETRAEVMGKDGFEEMCVASRPKFVAMAHAILRNREDAEDAVQNAFLSGYHHLCSFEGRSALTTWFTRIVLNAALMIQRKREPSRITPLSEGSSSHEVDWTESIPTWQPDPEMVHAERETLQFINGLLEKMKPTLRQAFTIIYCDELSGPEACAQLGVSAGTLKSRFFRARRQLQNQAQRALVAPIRTETHSSFSSDRSAFQHLLARPSNTSSLEALYS